MTDRLFNCFNPPEGSSFVKGKVYKWDWCIDGIIVYDDEVPFAFDIYEVFQYFSVISGW